jgi:hypothetical protein
MLAHILEGAAVFALIGMLSLLIGLLRSAKASSRVTEGHHDRFPG